MFMALCSSIHCLLVLFVHFFYFFLQVLFVRCLANVFLLFLTFPQGSFQSVSGGTVFQFLGFCHFPALCMDFADHHGLSFTSQPFGVHQTGDVKRSH